jgi:hypothetical protein
MKHMKKIIKLSIGLFILLFTACDLDYEPVSQLSENTLGTKDTTGVEIKYKDREAMLAVYRNIYQRMTGNQEHWYLDYLLFSECRSDNAYAGTTGAEVVPVETNSLDASNSVIARDWDRYMGDIAAANSIISNIDLVPDESLTKPERNQWKAEAKIYRAMIMFDMVRWFGNFPVITQEAGKITAENIEEVYPLYFPKSNTPAEAYAQIVSDLRSALEHAPAINNADKTILSKTVAKALLAKVYAERQVQNPDSVIYFADQVLADGISLVANYSDLFGLNDSGTDAKVRNTSESILELQYFTGSGNWVTWMFGRDLLDYDFYFTWAKWVTPSRDLIKAFDDAGDMKRKNESIVYYETTWSNYYDSKNYPFVYKCRSNVNSIIKLRGADIMLLKAEALARKDQLSQAAQVVNTVRQRVNLPVLSAAAVSSKESLLDAILLERRLELAFEGHRLFDLIRHEKLQSVMNILNQRDPGRLKQAREFSVESELLPIPQPVLDENTNLVQNPGY